jgi:hypothetical protein
MIDNADFPQLRAAASGSLIGAAALRMVAAWRVAWSTSAVTRFVDQRFDAMRRMPPALVVQSLGITFATAALAAWAMSLRIPTYLGTTIPAWAFFFAAVSAAMAAAWPEAFARHWSRSALRRVSLWFREP